MARLSRSPQGQSGRRPAVSNRKKIGGPVVHGTAYYLLVKLPSTIANSVALYSIIVSGGTFFRPRPLIRRPDSVTTSTKIYSYTRFSLLFFPPPRISSIYFALSDYHLVTFFLQPEPKLTSSRVHIALRRRGPCARPTAR